MAPVKDKLTKELGLTVRPPRWLILTAVLLVVASWVPVALVMRSRSAETDQPRFHFFQDMDNQPRYGAQAANPLLRSGMAMLPPVAGTVPRGGLRADDHYWRGFRMGPVEVTDPQTGQTTTQPGKVFFEDLPARVRVDERLLERGRKMYGVHCMVCHGVDGRGNGPVNERGLELNEIGAAGWVPVADLHGELQKQRPAGHLYNTINEGYNNMQPYGHQIDVYDRWAIVAYIKALQLSQDASIDVLSPEQRRSLP